MIVYNDILGKLKAAGWPTTRIRKEKIISQSTLQKLRTGDPITTESLDTICRLTGCQPGDLLSWEPDSEYSRLE